MEAGDARKMRSDATCGFQSRNRKARSWSMSCQINARMRVSGKKKNQGLRAEGDTSAPPLSSTGLNSARSLAVASAVRAGAKQGLFAVGLFASLRRRQFLTRCTRAPRAAVTSARVGTSHSCASATLAPPTHSLTHQSTPPLEEEKRASSQPHERRPFFSRKVKRKTDFESDKNS